MKRGLSVSFLVACALAGVLAAYAFAGGLVPLAGTTTTGTTTTTPSTTSVGTTTSTTPATTTTATTTTTTTVPAPRLLPEGVTIGGIPVGNLSPSEAASEIRAYFSTPLRLRLGKHVYTADPNALATPKITKAIARAKRARAFANLGLAVAVKTVKVRTFVASLALEVEKAPVDSHLILRNLKPYLTRERPGIALVQPATVNAVAKALRVNERGFVKLRTTKTKAEVTRKSFGPVIVIHRGSNRLYLYRGAKMNRIFPVATGQSVYPTPLGSFQIVVMWRNPWWYPPNSAWAKGEQPVPPGPNNPLGTRWMGISSPGVGIHGTNNDASIGYSVSHGCIRMHVHDAEWLFNHVVVGTPVFIVSA
jgi:lipoprotein-anchoring transpeptidase ErfK/SrfK